jgi:hypothetical protein
MLFTANILEVHFGQSQPSPAQTFLGRHDTQLPDGTVVFTSPSGHIHTTNREVAMPKRKCTRARYAADPPTFRGAKASLISFGPNGHVRSALA